MINLEINGKNQSFENSLSLSQLIEFLGLENKRIAIEVNEEIIPKSKHGSCQLADGDRIEIVHAIGGGGL